jgi:hypothetical protein
MDSLAGGSPRQLARIAGALYLINIVGGAFAITIVPAMLVVQATSQPRPRTSRRTSCSTGSGLAAHVVVTATNVPLAVIFYELFKVVSRRLALLDAFFILVATAIEAAGLLNQFAPLVLLGNGPYTSALSPSQIQALAYLPGDLASIDYTVHTVFFGLDILCSAYSCSDRPFFPEPSASCWPSTAWPTSATASPTSWRRKRQPTLFPGSNCPPSLVKDRSACGSSRLASTSTDGKSRRGRQSRCSPRNWRHCDESPQLGGCASSPTTPPLRLVVRPGREVMSLPCHPILCPKVGRGQVVAVTKLVILLVIPPAITGHVRNALDGRAC